MTPKIRWGQMSFFFLAKSPWSARGLCCLFPYCPFPVTVSLLKRFWVITLLQTPMLFNLIICPSFFFYLFLEVYNIIPLFRFLICVLELYNFMFNFHVRRWRMASCVTNTKIRGSPGHVFAQRWLIHYSILPQLLVQRGSDKRQVKTTMIELYHITCCMHVFAWRLFAMHAAILTLRLHQLFFNNVSYRIIDHICWSQAFF